MSNLLPPEPLADDGDRDEFHNEHHAEPPRGSRPRPRRRSRSPRRAPTLEELILRLDALMTMVLLGAIEPAQANVLRALIETMLRAIRGNTATARRASGPIDFKRWREFLRQHPGIADELAQFFTEEQLDELFEGFNDKEDSDDRSDNNGAA